MTDTPASRPDPPGRTPDDQPDDRPDAQPVDQPDDQRRVSASTTIAAPPEVVFAIVSDPYQHPRIDGSGSLRGAITGPHRLSRGATFGADMKLFGLPYSIRNRVVEFEPDRLIAWRHFGQHRWRYELDPTPDGGTEVTETWDASAYGPLAFGVLRLIGFPDRNRRGIEGTLVRLKAAAEQDAPAPDHHEPSRTDEGTTH